jgi:hypothetical protein
VCRLPPQVARPQGAGQSLQIETVARAIAEAGHDIRVDSTSEIKERSMSRATASLMRGRCCR